MVQKANILMPLYKGYRYKMQHSLSIWPQILFYEMLKNICSFDKCYASVIKKYIPCLVVSDTLKQLSMLFNGKHCRNMY